MGNLARKLQQEQQQRTVQQPKKVYKTKQGIGLSPGEKILGIVFSLAVCFGALQIVSNHAEIYQINKGIHETTFLIQEQTKVNNELAIQIEELSTYERILAKAKELGLKLNENNVKVVQQR